MRDAVIGDTDSRELDEQAEADETDQRERLGPAVMTATWIAEVLEDTSPSEQAPPRRGRRRV